MKEIDLTHANILTYQLIGVFYLLEKEGFLCIEKVRLKHHFNLCAKHSATEKFTHLLRQLAKFPHLQTEISTTDAHAIIHRQIQKNQSHG